jgi:hypothetical protein
LAYRYRNGRDPVNGELNHELESRGFDGNDGLESHMARVFAGHQIGTTSPSGRIGCSDNGIHGGAGGRRADLAASGRVHNPKVVRGQDCGSDNPGAGWRTPNVVDFYPVAQPGIEAPLGWTLSVYPQNSLKNQVVSLDNQCSAQIVASWFAAA